MLKLLFIDDEPASLEPLKRLLGRRCPGFEEETHDFPGARIRIADYRPDIVILDLADATNPQDPKPKPGIRSTLSGRSISAR